MSLERNNYKKDDCLIVELIGDLDIFSGDEFKDEMLKILKNERLNMVIDAKDLEYIDSKGLGALIGIYKFQKESNKTITIINVKSNVKKIFEITKLDEIFNIKE